MTSNKFAEDPKGNMVAIKLLSIIFLVVACDAYIRHSSISPFSLKPLYLFDFFNKKSPVNSAPKVTVDSKKVNEIKLEKISKTQNRDYNAVALARAPKPKEIADKQTISYNFGKSNEFPNLFKGWIKSDGDQIGKQIIAGNVILYFAS